MQDRLIFLIGSPRSGSTLTARMLGAHSAVFAPAETHLLTPLAHLGFYGSVEKAPYDLSTRLLVVLITVYFFSHYCFSSLTAHTTAMMPRIDPVDGPSSRWRNRDITREPCGGGYYNSIVYVDD